MRGGCAAAAAAAAAAVIVGVVVVGVGVGAGMHSHLLGLSARSQDKASQTAHAGLVSAISMHSCTNRERHRTAVKCDLSSSLCCANRVCVRLIKKRLEAESLGETHARVLQSWLPGR